MSDYISIHSPAGYVAAMLRREQVSQRDAAKRIGISEAYLCDMLRARRRIGPEMVELIVQCIETEDKDAARLDLHRLGAEADGWIVPAPLPGRT